MQQKLNKYAKFRLLELNELESTKWNRVKVGLCIDLWRLFPDPSVSLDVSLGRIVFLADLAFPSDAARPVPVTLVQMAPFAKSSGPPTHANASIPLRSLARIVR